MLCSRYLVDSGDGAIKGGCLKQPVSNGHGQLPYLGIFKLALTPLGNTEKPKGTSL